MKWIYLVVWTVFVCRDVPALWKAREWSALWLWLALAFAGLGMVWAYFWTGMLWRLAGG